MPITVGNDLRRNMANQMTEAMQYAIVDNFVVEQPENVVVIGSGITDSNGELTIPILDDQGSPFFADLNQCAIELTSWSKTVLSVVRNTFASPIQITNATGTIKVKSSYISAASLEVAANNVKVSYKITGTPAI